MIFIAKEENREEFSFIFVRDVVNDVVNIKLSDDEKMKNNPNLTVIKKAELIEILEQFKEYQMN